MPSDRNPGRAVRIDPHCSQMLQVVRSLVEQQYLADAGQRLTDGGVVRLAAEIAARSIAQAEPASQAVLMGESYDVPDPSTPGGKRRVFIPAGHVQAALRGDRKAG